MKPFQNIRAAVVEYFNVRYTPILVDATLARYLECPDIYTRWDLIGDNIATCYVGPAQFVLYVPDFVPDVSEITEIISEFVIEILFPKNGGVLLRFSKKMVRHHTVKEVDLSFRYKPNTGFMNDISIFVSINWSLILIKIWMWQIKICHYHSS
ncbi:hypothetical protein D0525_24145 [Salmonella enterica]|uniref:hypothetical protein n=1 Tax=Salmonella enterica TaxID=28901 RepID=UPI001011DF80|nr:hypothetical protein [Salmonella enterica]RXO32027.1 hypothetical protein D0525_24145 [Salmonella enterica]